MDSCCRSAGLALPARDAADHLACTGEEERNMSLVPSSSPRGDRKNTRGLARRVGLALLAPALATLTLGVAMPAAAQAATTGTIVGSFTVPAGTHSPQDLKIQLVDRNGNAVTVAPADLTITNSGTTGGAFTITNVNPGQYYVYFSDTTSGDNIARDYYGDGGTDNIGKATVVTVPVTGGAQTLATANLVAGATVTGTVTDANAAAETSSHVFAQLLDPNSVNDPQLGSVAATVTGGVYTISGLPASTYTLRYAATGATLRIADAYVDGAGVTYDFGSATNFALTATTPTTASFAVSAVGGISGTVTDSNGAPLAGVTVLVFSLAGTQLPVTATTAVDGTYTVPDIFAGQYQVEFLGLAGSNLGTTFFGGSTLAAASKVTVASGAIVPSINAQLAAAGTISGKVTAAQGGANVGGLEVQLLDAQGNVMAMAFTNPDGTYTLKGVPAGTWYVEFVGGRAYNGQYYATMYYIGKGTLGNSQAVKVAAGQAVTGINEALMAESTTLAGLPKISNGSLSGLSSNKVALKFKLAAGSGPAGYLQSFAIKLPKNVSWNKSTLKKNIVIAHDTFTYVIKSGKLVIAFATGKKTVSFQIKAGGITVTKGIQNQAKKKSIKSMAIDVAVTDTTGKATSTSFTVKTPH
jgi:Carboxypeptidase regulatory-like domain